MHKQILLNTLLLIGAICLSTRGFANTDALIDPDQGTNQIVQQGLSQGTDLEAQITGQNTQSEFAAEDDTSEDMD